MKASIYPVNRYSGLTTNAASGIVDEHCEPPMESGTIVISNHPVEALGRHESPDSALRSPRSNRGVFGLFSRSSVSFAGEETKPPQKPADSLLPHSGFSIRSASMSSLSSASGLTGTGAIEFQRSIEAASRLLFEDPATSVLEQGRPVSARGFRTQGSRLERDGRPSAPYSARYGEIRRRSTEFIEQLGAPTSEVVPVVPPVWKSGAFMRFSDHPSGGFGAPPLSHRLDTARSVFTEESSVTCLNFETEMQWATIQNQLRKTAGKLKEYCENEASEYEDQHDPFPSNQSSYDSTLPKSFDEWQKYDAERRADLFVFTRLLDGVAGELHRRVCDKTIELEEVEGSIARAADGLFAYSSVVMGRAIQQGKVPLSGQLSKDTSAGEPVQGPLLIEAPASNQVLSPFTPPPVELDEHSRSPVKVSPERPRAKHNRRASDGAARIRNSKMSMAVADGKPPAVNTVTSAQADFLKAGSFHAAHVTKADSGLARDPNPTRFIPTASLSCFLDAEVASTFQVASQSEKAILPGLQSLITQFGNAGRLSIDVLGQASQNLKAQIEETSRLFKAFQQCTREKHVNILSSDPWLAERGYIDGVYSCRSRQRQYLASVLEIIEEIIQLEAWRDGVLLDLLDRWGSAVEGRLKQGVLAISEFREQVTKAHAHVVCNGRTRTEVDAVAQRTGKQVLVESNATPSRPEGSGRLSPFPLQGTGDQEDTQAATPTSSSGSPRWQSVGDHVVLAPNDGVPFFGVEPEKCLEHTSETSSAAYQPKDDETPRVAPCDLDTPGAPFRARGTAQAVPPAPIPFLKLAPQPAPLVQKPSNGSVAAGGMGDETARIAALQERRKNISKLITWLSSLPDVTDHMTPYPQCPPMGIPLLQQTASMVAAPVRLLQTSEALLTADISCFIGALKKHEAEGLLSDTGWISAVAVVSEFQFVHIFEKGGLSVPLWSGNLKIVEATIDASDCFVHLREQVDSSTSSVAQRFVQVVSRMASGKPKECYLRFADRESFSQWQQALEGAMKERFALTPSQGGPKAVVPLKYKDLDVETPSQSRAVETAPSASVTSKSGIRTVFRFFSHKS